MWSPGESLRGRGASRAVGPTSWRRALLAGPDRAGEHETADGSRLEYRPRRRILRHDEAVASETRRQAEPHQRSNGLASAQTPQIGDGPGRSLGHEAHDRPAL